MTLTRRALLSGASALPIASHAGLLFHDGADPVFEDVVRQVAGVAGIAPLLIRSTRDAFVAKFGQPALLVFAQAMRGRLVEDVAAGEGAIADQVRFIAVVLFTGEIEANGRSRALLYPWSLAWATLGFTKAPGLCGGPAFGHWEHAP